MSKLLLDERPLVLQPKLAVLLGSADEAIVFQQLHYWIQRSNNFHDGHTWVYNSMAEWKKQFPWIKATSTLRRYFTDLEKRGLVLVGNYNRAGFDRTKWYTIDYSRLQELENAFAQNEQMEVFKMSKRNCSKSANGSAQNERTNTIDYTESTTENSSLYLPGRSPGNPPRGKEENGLKSNSKSLKAKILQDPVIAEIRKQKKDENGETISYHDELYHMVTDFLFFDPNPTQEDINEFVIHAAETYLPPARAEEIAQERLG